MTCIFFISNLKASRLVGKTLGEETDNLEARRSLGKSMAAPSLSRIALHCVQPLYGISLNKESPMNAGDVNAKGQRLVQKTQQPSTTHPFAKIWVLQCDAR